MTRRVGVGSSLIATDNNEPVQSESKYKNERKWELSRKTTTVIDKSVLKHEAHTIVHRKSIFALLDYKL